MASDKTLPFILGILTLLGVLYGAAGQWFGLQYRVQRLEEHEMFIHGDVSQFVKDAKR